MQSADFSIYDYVDQPIFVLGADTSNRPVYKYLNKRGRDTLGKRMDQIVERAAHEVFSGRAAYSLYRRQCAAWAGATDCEYEIALPIGTGTMWVRTRLRPVHDANGAMTHMVGTSFDITEERNQVQEQAMVVAAAREMEDLVCMAAHDLRSPIGNLKSLAEIMRRDFVDHGDGKAQLIDMIDSIADKTLSVVSEIMVQAMATNAPAHREVFDLGALCDDILVLLDPMRTHSVAYPRMLIEADYTPVHIILRNLIDNAFKHAADESVRIEITVEQMNAARLRFSVHDNGPGFSSMNFGPDMDGIAAGFGLLGVRRLAHSRGGKLIIAQPKAGAGAEVQLEMPGRFAEAVADQPASVIG